MTDDRVETGIDRLDFILDGGLPRHNLHLIHGPPGSGKTVAANQMCFFHAKEYGDRAIYLTVAAESHAKILDGIRHFDYFDPECVGDEIAYVSGYSTLRDDGLDGLLAVIRESLQRHEANLLVLDGIQTVRLHAEDPKAYRAWLHLFQSSLTMLETTGVMLATCHPEGVNEEATVADGVIELTHHLVGPRFVREIIVYKMRGSNHLPGRHQVEISDAGVTVHPRTEVQFAEPAAIAREDRERMCFGIDELDRMLHGGVLSGSTTAIIGAPGTGKTTLGLSFLAEGARKGQKSYYFGFAEPPPRLIERADNLGMDLREHVEEGTLEILWQPPLEHFMDSLAEHILERLRDSHDSPRRRLFIDGVEGFVAAAVYSDRLRRFLSALANQLRTLDVTTLISEEIIAGELDRIEALTVPIAESAIALQSVRHRAAFHRLLSVIKMRENAYERYIHEFDITEDGFNVDADHTSAERLLSSGCSSHGGER